MVFLNFNYVLKKKKKHLCVLVGFSQRMKESDELTIPPTEQKMDRSLSPSAEHKDAMERALLLDVPHVKPHEESSEENGSSPLNKTSSCSDSKYSSRSMWDELVEELLDEEEAKDLARNEDLGVVSKGQSFAES